MNHSALLPKHSTIPSSGDVATHSRAAGASTSNSLLAITGVSLLTIAAWAAVAGAYEGALEGPGGTLVDIKQNNVLQQNQLTLLSIPSGGYPSPLFGARSFTQKLLIAEEFGCKPLPASYARSSVPFPCVPDAQSMPTGREIEDYLAQPMFPACSRLANCVDANPWQQQIEQYLGRPLVTPPCEGRPEGEDFAHQRWSEFPAQVYFQSAMTGAREGLGLRDSLQLSLIHI